MKGLSIMVLVLASVAFLSSAAVAQSIPVARHYNQFFNPGGVSQDHVPTAVGGHPRGM